MILITSAAYVSEGLVTEIGELPPVMLPLQNKRLYEHQIELFSREEEIFISLPLDFVLNKRDKKQFDLNGIQPIYVPQNLSLGASVVYVLNVIGKPNERIRILHGDTILKNIPIENDLFVISHPQDNYKWSYTSKTSNSFVYAGYFCFSKQSLLIKNITENDNSFIKGVNAYRKFVNCKEVFTDFWLDFGLVNSYFRSKSRFTTQRIFNDLQIDRFFVKKSSFDKKKMNAEANWFRNVPLNMKAFLPALWEIGEKDEKAYYSIEYLYLNTLSDLFVFGNHPLFIWKEIIKSCKLFVDTGGRYVGQDDIDLDEYRFKMYFQKTHERLNSFSDQLNVDLDKDWRFNGKSVPSLNELFEKMYQLVPAPNKKDICVIHGDFCFSNILYDFKTQSIKVIDPRGLDFEGRETVFGDVRYELGKLAHSILGLYDFIIAGSYSLKGFDSYDLNFEIYTNSITDNIQNYFQTLKFDKKNLNDLSTYPILVLLFLSMLPLHNDYPERQKAMVANAFRLYLKYVQQ